MLNKFHFVQGGADRHYLDLIKLLKSKGHQVIPFAMQDPKNLPTAFAKYFVKNVKLREVKLGLESLRIIGRILYSWEARQKIKKLIHKEKPDLAHLHNIYHQISPSILTVLKKEGIPIVMTVHDYKLVCPNYRLFNQGQICKKCKKRKYFYALFNKCVKDSYLASGLNCLEMYFHKAMKFYEKNVDLFICPSQFMQKTLKDWGLPQEKLVTLPHFTLGKNLTKVKRGGKYVLFFGRLSLEKGIDDLIKTAQDLPEIKFKIAGDGPEKKRIKRKLQKLKIRNVSLLGFQEKKNLRKIISLAHCVVVPSIWHEVFGLTIIESFQYGKPVIARKRGAISELIQEGENGFLFEDQKELTEKIKLIFGDQSLYKKLGQNALTKFEDHDPHLYYLKLRKLYNSQLKRSGSKLKKGI